MTTPSPRLPLDSGLLDRFRLAGTQIVWRSAPVPKGKPGESRTRAPKGHDDRQIAHLNDEEASVERRGPTSTPTVVVDSGPVGALVLVLEMDQRGLPHRLTTHESGHLPGFPHGALEASWAVPVREAPLELPLSDLVGLARYALA
jgi:hypothetical protein